MRVKGRVRMSKCKDSVGHMLPPFTDSTTTSVRVQTSQSIKLTKLQRLQFKLFKIECMYWIDVFGLKMYELYFEQCNMTDCIAGLSSSSVSKVAVFKLALTITGEDASEYGIRRSAFHEVMELLLGEYRDIASSRWAAIHEEDAARHAVIRTLENVVFDGDSRLGKLDKPGK